MTNVKQLSIARTYAFLAQQKALIADQYTDKYLQALYIATNTLEQITAYNDNQYQTTSLISPEYLYRKLELSDYVYIESKSKWMKITHPIQLELPTQKEDEIVP